MTRFLIAFFSIYSLLHFFFYIKVKAILPESCAFHALLILFLAAMVFAPPVLEWSGRHLPALVLAHVGYPWMGFLFLSLCCFLPLGTGGLLVHALNRIAGTNIPWPSDRLSIAMVLGSVLLVNVYGCFEAHSIRIERLEIKTPKLPRGTQRLRIAQISDVHLGLLVGEERVKAILDKVRSESPDILVSTGDLVDENFGETFELEGLFRTVEPPYGKFAITGNHEFDAGIDKALRATESFGFTMLRGEVRQAGCINIAGIDDPAGGMPSNEPDVLLRASGDGRFILFLKHRPVVEDESLGLFDLQLSGHTHRGQIFPFRYLSSLSFPLQEGLHHLPRGALLYVSRGSGTWGPPIRVLAPPEVTIIDLVREQAGSSEGDKHP